MSKLPNPRHLLLVLVVLSALFLSSCQIRFAQATTVEEDGSGEFTITFAVDRQLRELIASQSGETIDFTDPESWEGSGEFISQIPDSADYEVEAYVVDDFEGFVVRVPFASPEELEAFASEADGGASGLPMITVDGDVYRLDYRFDVDELAGEQMDLGVDLSSVFDVTFSARLPGEVTSTNGSLGEDGVVTWDLDLGGSDTSLTDETGAYALFVESRRPGAGLVWWILGGLLVVGVVAGAFLFGRRKRVSSVDRILSNEETSESADTVLAPDAESTGESPGQPSGQSPG